VTSNANSAFLDYYRCPEVFATFAVSGELSEENGYFRFGTDAICYGQSTDGFRARRATDDLYDASPHAASNGETIQLPFNPSDVAFNLRYERYSASDKQPDTVAALVRKAYYLARPVLPVSVRKHLQRTHLRRWDSIPFPNWPVDPVVERIFETLLRLLLRRHESVPFVWFWPNGAQSCAIMTHDVETSEGRDFCTQLMDLNDAYDIKSSFQIVPENRYAVSERFLAGIRNRGFEVNVHDLNHDGHLFRDRDQFLRRAERINQYGREFGAAGFRSAVLYRNLDWSDALEFSYDMSVPSVGHLEAQQGGCCSVMPFFVGAMLELPVTTTQDYSLFHILNIYSADLWKRQVALITERHGLASFITHPDYLREYRARLTYQELLAHLARLRLDGTLWCALPKDVDRWWRERSQMRVTRRDDRWQIEGPGHERARLAYAHLQGDRISYTIDPAA
jgi:hypothetical protein